MKEGKCYTCDKVTHSLLTANCNHKICFNCVKNNRTNHKCSYCLMTGSKNKLQALSPARKQALERERTTKTKSIESHRNHQESSPAVDRSSRKSQVHIQSYSNYMEGSTYEDQKIEVKLLCKQHHEPLTLFSKSSKQAICSTCLCSKPKYKQEIMPIKNAQQFLRKENQIQREESRVILGDIQKCHRIMKVNFEQFEKYYGSHVKIVNEIFNQLHRQLEEKEQEVRGIIDKFFVEKLQHCQEIEQDLAYLIETLQTYRDENRDSNTLTESLYVYSSFKVIKKTMKTLNLDYISYSGKNVNLLEYNKGKYDDAVFTLLKFHQDLPLKHDEIEAAQAKKRGNSASISRQKTSGYSHKKGSIYENLLNQRMNLKHEEQRKSISRTIESAKKKIENLYNDDPSGSKSHNNSLSSYIHQNLEKQRPRHNNSTNSYLNNYSKSDQKPTVTSGFDYELRTPIKQIVQENQSNSKKVKTPENTEFMIKQSIDRAKKGEVTVVSTNSISGLQMNDEQKSLYKRLLKSRFKKTTQQEQHGQTEHEKIDEQQGEEHQSREEGNGD